jgi:hypothetical protein
MTDDKYDDGLVHNHGWAAENPAPAHQRALPAQAAEDHDDGLVHSHGWACSERGRMAEPAARGMSGND